MNPRRKMAHTIDVIEWNVVEDPDTGEEQPYPACSTCHSFVILDPDNDEPGFRFIHAPTWYEDTGRTISHGA